MTTRKPRTVWVLALNGKPLHVRSSQVDAEYAIHRMEYDIPGKWTCFKCVEVIRKKKKQKRKVSP